MKTGAILVLYNPDMSRTKQVVERMLTQVDAICAIDNSDNGKTECLFGTLPNVKYIPLHGNYGIAKAQNEGIRYFREQHFDFIVFIDQDTLPEENTVNRLLASWQCLDNEGIKVGAVAPIAIDHFTKQPVTYSIAQKGSLNIGDKRFLEVIHTMSSMSLINLKMFDEAGLMWEQLFIDAVDCEWCWRAAHKTGARFFYDYDVHMDHVLGVGSKTIGRRSIHITPPYRMYYQYRNFIWLLRIPYVPRRWLRKNAVKYLLKIPYYLISGPDRLAYLKNIARGIRDGVSRKVKR
jgi:rhamnosyltransferase